MNTTKTITRHDLANRVEETFMTRLKGGGTKEREILERIGELMFDAINEGKIEHNCGEDIVENFTTSEDIYERFTTVQAAFDAALTARSYNPFRSKEEADSFTWSADFFAFDSLGHLYAIRDWEDVAFWNRWAIELHIEGKWISEELDRETLEEIAGLYDATLEAEEDEADEEEEA